MSATLHRTARIEFERGIASECEYPTCDRGGNRFLWMARRADGSLGVVVLCSHCCDMADQRSGYHYLGQVLESGGEADGE